MNEEEKEAIYELEDIKFEERINKKIDIVLNLIKKQQKEIEERLKEIDSLYKMMSAKDDEIESYKERYENMKWYFDNQEDNLIHKNRIKEKRKWTIEGLTQLKNIMYYYSMKGNNVYIESPLNFMKALDNALELLGE